MQLLNLPWKVLASGCQKRHRSADCPSCTRPRGKLPIRSQLHFVTPMQSRAKINVKITRMYCALHALMRHSDLVPQALLIKNSETLLYCTAQRIFWCIATTHTSLKTRYDFFILAKNAYDLEHTPGAMFCRALEQRYCCQPASTLTRALSPDARDKRAKHSPAERPISDKATNSRLQQKKKKKSVLIDAEVTALFFSFSRTAAENAAPKEMQQARLSRLRHSTAAGDVYAPTSTMRTQLPQRSTDGGKKM